MFELRFGALKRRHGYTNQLSPVEFERQHFFEQQNRLENPRRFKAILLVGGDKGGADQRRFYKRLIQVADERYDEHVGSLSQQSKENHHGKKTR